MANISMKAYVSAYLDNAPVEREIKRNQNEFVSLHDKFDAASRARVKALETSIAAQKQLLHDTKYLGDDETVLLREMTDKILEFQHVYWPLLEKKWKETIIEDGITQIVGHCSDPYVMNGFGLDILLMNAFNVPATSVVTSDVIKLILAHEYALTEFKSKLDECYYIQPHPLVYAIVELELNDLAAKKRVALLQKYNETNQANIQAHRPGATTAADKTKEEYFTSNVVFSKQPSSDKEKYTRKSGLAAVLNTNVPASGGTDDDSNVDEDAHYEFREGQDVAELDWLKRIATALNISIATFNTYLHTDFDVTVDKEKVLLSLSSLFLSHIMTYWLCKHKTDPANPLKTITHCIETLKTYCLFAIVRLLKKKINPAKYAEILREDVVSYYFSPEAEYQWKVCAQCLPEGARVTATSNRTREAEWKIRCFERTKQVSGIRQFLRDELGLYKDKTKEAAINDAFNQPTVTEIRTALAKLPEFQKSMAAYKTNYRIVDKKPSTSSSSSSSSSSS